MLFDSEFLISYSGQRGAAKKLAADQFANEHLDAPLYTSRVCWSEFAEGCETLDLVEAKLSLFVVLEIDERVAWTASRIARNLGRLGLPIGDNDVWVAATAVVYQLPLVSRNRRHFGRVNDLEVMSY